MPASRAGAASRRSPAPWGCSIEPHRSASPLRCFSTPCAGRSAHDEDARLASTPMGHIRILGIDPGLRTTGFGVVDCEGPALHYVASGTIRSEAESAGLPARLKTI